MKTAASIFSWLGGIATTIYAFVMLSQGQIVTKYYYNYYGGGYYQTERVPFPTWVWVLAIIFAVIRLIILIWRQKSVEEGNKVGCGVCTLIFASVIGGILTLCIPEDQLGGYSNYPNKYQTHSKYVSRAPKKYSMTERREKIEANNELLSRGVITRAEYDRRKKEIDANTIGYYPQASSSAQKEIDEEKKLLIQKYKDLLDANLITPEEFEQKKNDILSK